MSKRCRNEINITWKEYSIKVGIIGVGNIGSKYACMIQNNEIEGMTLGALTRLKEDKKILLSKSLEAGVPVFESAELLFEALEKGEIELDAVIITTPHYSHSEIAISLSSWMHKMVEIPKQGSNEEKIFESDFEEKLKGLS